MENYENNDFNIADDSAQNVPEENSAEPAQQPEQNQFYNEPQPAENPKTKNDIPAYGLSVASLVLGLASMIPALCCFQPILAVLAIIFGAVARSKGNRSGMSLAAIILGGISLLLCVAQSFLMFELFDSMPDKFNNFDSFGYYYDF